MTKTRGADRAKKWCGMTLGALTLLVSQVAVAGDAGTWRQRGPDPDRMLAHMAAALDLTSEQQEAVGQALEARADEMASLREQMRANHREMRDLDPDDPNYSTMVNALAQRQGELTTRMAVLRSEMHADIVGVLDEGQQARFTEMREKRGDRMRERYHKYREYRHQRSGSGKPEAGTNGS
ncbi:MAG: Spy/CpxP family protein refolding chaperone [Gammaproteobacteria bacterium]|jgi:Spy/CpxP family protein refolding chaperone